MIVVIARDTVTGRERRVEIPAEAAPSLRSALTEMRNELGERAKGAYAFKKEHSITRAIIGTAALASTLNHVITEDDPDYE